MEHHKEGYESEVEPPSDPSSISSEDESYNDDSSGTKVSRIQDATFGPSFTVPLSPFQTTPTPATPFSEDDQLSICTPSIVRSVGP